MMAAEARRAGKGDPANSTDAPAGRGARAQGLGGFRWLLAAVVLVGAVVRLVTLGQQSLWLDEATTYTIVSHSFGHVLSAVPRTESTPPVYYVLLWLWTRVSGTDAGGLRSLSALCGIGTIAIIALAARQLWDDRAGLAAGLLTCLSPIMIWYSQEARAYALGILLSAVSVLLLIRACEELSHRRLLLWGLSAALALSVHYFTGFVLVPEAAWLLIALWRADRLSPASIAACLAPPVVLGGALLPLLIHQADGRAAVIASNEGSLPQRVVRLVKQDILGLNEPAKAALSAIAILLIIAVVLLAASSTRGAKRRLALPVAIGGGGLLLTLIAAAAGSDYIDTRNLLFIWPAFALLAGGAIAGTTRKPAALAVLGCVCALEIVCAASVVITPLYQRANWRGLARALGPATHGPRAIIGSYYTVPSLAPYQTGVETATGADIGVREIDVFYLSLQSSPPLRPTHLPPPPTGFRLIEDRAPGTYTLLRYVSTATITEPVAGLGTFAAATGLGQNPVFIQRVTEHRGAGPAAAVWLRLETAGPSATPVSRRDGGGV